MASTLEPVATIDPSAWVCPLPLRDYPAIVIGHGGGGVLSAELVEHVFLPAFGNAALDALGDAAVLPLAGAEATGRLAFTTDSFVVRPLFFPGGCVGDLAINGTVNDLAMRGARPKWLSAGFILEEGLPMATLGAIVQRMAAAARAAGVQIVAGDTKVVERGHGDGCYINTSGIGVIDAGVEIGPSRARPGDVVLVSGSIGDHGMAIMSVREGLSFESAIVSDCQPLHGLVDAVLSAVPPGAVRVLRDPTRGGLAASLTEIAQASQVGIALDEARIPVHGPVASACELLGLDPMHVANEGKAVAIVDAAAADAALSAMRAHPAGREAARIGVVTAEHPRMLVSRTAIGATRVVAPALGEQLPRIC
ncbi:MAG: hydrogenase expression/formation protein HypE [Gemmatimonadaceae bacterium]|jgi:hydrogenase expression/formation protein HypE|nr:hydrogenase expression/formation protein HypE [Gemmatimonadaceae bacterium]